MAGDYVLAIDQGTTSSRAIVFNHDSATVGEAQQEFTQHYPRPGWVEHDANEIWDVTLGVMRQAIDDAGISPGDIAGIGITNQRETVALWDRETGEPVHNAIVWQDRRGAQICTELSEAGNDEMVANKTGLVIDAYFSGSKVKWLLDNVDGVKERAQNGEIAFGTIDTWLIYKITGVRAHVTDYTNASRTLMYNIFDLQWDDELLEMLGGVPRAALPDVKPSSYVYGDTDAGVFGAEVPVAGVAGDQQAALFGEVAFDRGLTKNTYGTGSFALMNTGTEPIKSERAMLTTIAWGLGDEPVEYALEGAIFITGAAVQWLRDGLGIIESAEETEELAASLESNDDVFFVPALVGLGAPHWDSYARGTIVGLTRGSTRAHLARAALEAMCYQTRDAVEAMEADSGTDIPTFKADGGAAANRWMMQFQADILGTPVEVPETLETTALGAAYLAGLATGFWEDREELKNRWRLRRRYEPQMDEEERERLYGRWQEAVARADAPVEGKVALVSGGGSGHEPTHGGFVGPGMLDAACAGAVFTSPTPHQMFEASKAVDGGAGVFYVVKNYTGDVLNFEMAGELGEAEGIETDYVVTNDDVAVEDSTYTSGRRGIAGTIFVHKICGAAADEGKDLAGIKELAERVNSNVRSMGMALTSCTPPESGEPIFDIGDDEMEIGIGIHGEPGVERKNVAPADQIVDEMLEKILGDSVDFSGSEVAVMVNGMGGTPLMELYVAYSHVADVLEREGVGVWRMPYVGDYMTSLEMAGFSITLLKLDDEMKTYLSAPCDVAAGRPF